MDLFAKRTDLALESAQTVSRNGRLPDGIELSTRRTDCFEITDISVLTPEAAGSIQKPIGRYVTCEAGSRLDMKPENFTDHIKRLSDEIKSFLGGAENILVAGLGNENITPDSLGPRGISKIFATRHIKENAPAIYSDGLGVLSAIAPGVMGQTGVEASEIVAAVCRTVKPDAVITVDALACSEAAKIGKTVQLTDAGISPGSGVMNSRRELSSKTLGVELCLAIGVPTVSESREKGKEPLMVTPRSVDKLVLCTAELIAMAINTAVHTGLGLSELESLVG